MAKQTISGTDQAEVLAGSFKSELIEALAGDDVIVAGAGNDTVRGGDGDDVLAGEDGNDKLIGDTGNDVMLGGDGDDKMTWNNGDGSDVMEGGEGHDTAIVNGADAAGDIFEIAGDADRVSFQRVNLGPFSLDIGSTEKLKVNGQGGDDEVNAAALVAGLIKLKVDGGAGNDSIVGSQGDDHLKGGEGDDLLVGGQGNDKMLGGDGDDTMVWNNGDGSDVMDGGDGHDTAVVNGADAAGDAFEVSSNAGDVLFERTNLGPFTIDIRETERLRVNGQGGDDEVDASALEAGLIKLKVDGGAGNDSIVGSQGDDHLKGGEGDDLLVGGQGNDKMLGGDGDDTMVWNNGDGSDVMDGGEGHDTAVVNGADAAGDAFEVSSNAGDVLFERTNLGPFTIDIRETEKLRVNGQGGDDEIDASALEAGLIKLKVDGGAGNDSIVGSQGNDYLYGGAGNDELTGGDGADVFVFKKGADTISDFEDGIDVIRLKSSAYESYDELEGIATQQGDDAVFDFGQGNVLTLEDTLLANLDESDFSF